MKPFDIALATLPPALWAITYVVAKPATAHFPPMFLVGMIYASDRGDAVPPMALAHAVLDAAGLRDVGRIGQSALIYSALRGSRPRRRFWWSRSEVPFAVLAAWAIGQERLNLRRLAGIAVALAGVAVVACRMPQARPVACFSSSSAPCRGARHRPLIRARSRDSGGELMGAIALFSSPQLFVFSFVLERGQIEAVTSAGWPDWRAVLVLAVVATWCPTPSGTACCDAIASTRSRPSSF